MKLITFAGPPSSGKTSVIIKLIEAMAIDVGQIGVVKFDCLTYFDNLRYEEKGVRVETGSGMTDAPHLLARLGAAVATDARRVGREDSTEGAA